MKKVKLIGLLILFIAQMQAQTLEINLEESKNTAKNSGKNILMFFSGSDWCKPCIVFKKNIIEDDEFIQFSEENLVLLNLDFPYSKKNRLPEKQQIHNEKLAEIYNKEGSFPKVILLDENAELLGEIAYQKNSTPTYFKNEIERLSSK